MCRNDLLEKKEYIKIEHVPSHRGTQSPEQQGNDLADHVANMYRRLGQLMPPKPYFTEFEERFVMFHNDKCLQGDVRHYLKSLERDKMLETWKNSAPKQAMWTCQFPHPNSKSGKTDMEMGNRKR